MLQPLVVGLGRSGSGLHLKTLARLARRTEAAGDPLVALPVVGCDPRAEAPGNAGAAGALTAFGTLDEALARIDPAATVAHVCTPPRLRYDVIARLAGHGIRRLIVEKPLAASLAELDALVRLRERADLDVVVVSHWTGSRLTGRLRRLVRDETLGPLRRITVDQHKPRFLRSLTTDGHPSALDVEIPHSLALALDLAGPAELRAARCWDLRCEDRVLPALGGAHVELEHRSGVTTLLRSDLGAAVRQRSVVCAFEGGTATAHFPLSEDDDHAQLIVRGADAEAGHQVFRDDALTDFLAAAYRGFASGTAGAMSFALACTTARLLCGAREHCAVVGRPDAVPTAAAAPTPVPPATVTPTPLPPARVGSR
ncbi:Gfo/Idh/MocA family oxidoreductase [Streptomyces sp. HF10]|uniref:Gfo/Idh/MocA family oxidoreductase n=1 Tax=Streptomyces sp. HF10 TaxID=2692233 RepID=UPI0013176475|nr:Gfo/Idh/MocA family oxidoreductase [Streptomyces sp. HF10]QHC32957.1 Gfo/Idh/MocA family oxidoreductase [Streptomyces sp. HF10]